MISLTISIFASLARDAAVVVGVSFVANERAEIDVIGCAFMRSWMSEHERAERPICEMRILSFSKSAKVY